MQTITAEEVELIWDRVMSWSETEAEARMKVLADLQPAVVAYLLHLEEEFVPPDEQGSLLQLGMFILEAMSPSDNPLPPIEPEALEEREEQNIKWIENLDEGSESDYQQSVSFFAESHPQAPLLRVLLEGLMSGHEENPELAPDNIGILFLQLKTVVESLDGASA